MRDIVLGSLLFVGILALALPSAFAAPPSIAAPTPSPSHSAAESGPGFTVCNADETWRRPSEIEQLTYFESDPRFAGTFETPDTAGYRAFRAPAVLYDGSSVDGLHWIVDFTGLWNVWTDPATRPKTCFTQQPQVFLFGYEPVRYDAQDPAEGVLEVRPASGFRMVVLTGPVRARIAVTSSRRLDELAVPDAWVTPAR